MLEALAKAPGTHVAIVTGRPREFPWLRDLPVYVVAEHGLWIRRPDGSWSTAIAVDSSWRPKVRKTMGEFVERVQGSYIEEASTAWRYRNVDPNVGEAAAELVDSLTALLTGSGSTILRARRRSRSSRRA